MTEPITLSKESRITLARLRQVDPDCHIARDHNGRFVLESRIRYGSEFNTVFGELLWIPFPWGNDPDDLLKEVWFCCRRRVVRTSAWGRHLLWCAVTERWEDEGTPPHPVEIANP